MPRRLGTVAQSISSAGAVGSAAVLGGGAAAALLRNASRASCSALFSVRVLTRKTRE